ncbi:MAG: DUF742 domain-containing protein [Acidimicrobiales bacterium]
MIDPPASLGGPTAMSAFDQGNRPGGPEEPAVGGSAGTGAAPPVTGPETDIAVDLLAVRPYLLTQGRTVPRLELALEDPVETSPSGRDIHGRVGLEQDLILELCVAPTPVVEVAGRLDLPLPVVLVLLADLVVDGHLEVRRAATSPSTGGAGRPDVALLERVLDGLHRL